MQKLTASVTLHILEAQADPVGTRAEALNKMLAQLKAEAIDYAYQEYRSDYTIEMKARIYVATEEEFNEAVHHEALRIVNFMKAKELPCN